MAQGRAGALALLLPDATHDRGFAMTTSFTSMLLAAALALPFVVFCQAHALLQSLALGLRPDTPSMSGAVNRVVRGVTIYPFTQGASDVPRR
jgi:tagatose-6-phosphate ketose/aldose isomerase